MQFWLASMPHFKDSRFVHRTWGNNLGEQTMKAPGRIPSCALLIPNRPCMFSTISCVCQGKLLSSIVFCLPLVRNRAWQCKKTHEQVKSLYSKLNDWAYQSWHQPECLFLALCLRQRFHSHRCFLLLLKGVPTIITRKYSKRWKSASKNAKNPENAAQYSCVTSLASIHVDEQVHG